MIKFEFNYDGSELISNGKTTLLEVAQDICNKAGVELSSTSFLNSDKNVSVYDNTVTAREYISYIAESAGCFACIDREGKLCFREFYQDETEIPLDMFGEYKWGEEFKISKVSYEDGVRSFKFGDDTRNNLWINQENMYIVDEEQIQKIYDKVKGLTVNTFNGKTVIDPAIDIGDKIVIDGRSIIYQGEMSLEGRFIAQISSKIQIKQKEEATVKSESQKVVNRRVQTRIKQAEGKIEQLVEETSENTQNIAKQEISINGISQEVSKKVGNDEFSTKLQTDYESVQIAWNKISDFIKMMIINNNASLAILDKNKNIMMALDKEGQHFYKNDGTTVFGKMGVNKIDDKNYISFSVPTDYNKSIEDGMAWGVITKSDGKFWPIMYVKNFNMPQKNSGGCTGELILDGCDLVLGAINSGIITGNIKIHGDAMPGIFFSDSSTGEVLLSINPSNVIQGATISILGNISFYKNQAGSNSFKIGNDENNYCLFTDDGSIYGSHLAISDGSNGVYIDPNGKVSGNALYFYELPTYQGDKLVYGQFGHRYFLEWTGSQLQFWVDATNVGTLSDKRLKTEIQDIDDDFIKAIEEIEMRQFKVANRNGLISFGILAQDLIEIFKKYGKKPFDYEIVYQTQYRTDDDTVYYAINYEQFLILKQKATDKKLEQLQEKDKQKDEIIADLIKRIETLEKGEKQCQNSQNF